MPDPTIAAREELRTRILGGEYAPLQRLVEAELCDQLGVGRSTVRSALQDLSRDGLVELQRNKGARVRAITVEEAVEIAEARRALEGFIAARAAERATTDDIDELREIGRRMRGAVDAGDNRRYSELNARLHTRIRAVADHATVADLLERLRGQMVRHQFLLSLMPGRAETSLPEHESIIEAIAQGDGPIAEKAMRAHIDSVIDAIRSLPNSRFV
jgi:DNA-binding GntR family transcriptional regulator